MVTDVSECEWSVIETLSQMPITMDLRLPPTMGGKNSHAPVRNFFGHSATPKFLRCYTHIYIKDSNREFTFVSLVDSAVLELRLDRYTERIRSRY